MLRWNRKQNLIRELNNFKGKYNKLAVLTDSFLIPKSGSPFTFISKCT